MRNIIDKIAIFLVWILLILIVVLTVKYYMLEKETTKKTVTVKSDQKDNSQREKKIGELINEALKDFK
ncbi:MAG: hypothetical protein DSZ08_04175 [Sulfurovum sp.]|nr:MAG: hypothetical protein DSZ08_04175 [Sulfurovum sp.]